MTIKEARELVESYEKLHPDYKKAVKMCIEDDKPKVEKPEVKAEVKVKSKVEPKVKTEVKDARS